MNCLPFAALFESKSATDTILATSYLNVSARSWPIAIRPKPICPTFIFSLGAFFPNTLDGTIVGNPVNATDESSVAFTEESMNFLLDIVLVSYTHLRAHETRHDLVCRL